MLTGGKRAAGKEPGMPPEPEITNPPAFVRSDLTKRWDTKPNASPKRNLRDLRPIAEIVFRFDVVAVQETRGDLRALRHVLKALGEEWAVNAGGLFHTGRVGGLPFFRNLVRVNSLLYRQSTAFRRPEMVARFQAFERARAKPPEWGRRGVLFGLATTFETPSPAWVGGQPEHEELRLKLALVKTRSRASHRSSADNSFTAGGGSPVAAWPHPS